MGTSTFAKYTVVPEIALAKIREDAPFDKVCLLGCGVTTGIGAVLNTAKVPARGQRRRLRARRHRPLGHPGRRAWPAPTIIGVDVNPAKFDIGAKFGATDFVDPSEVPADARSRLVKLTDGGVDYSFECIGNVEVMGQALECCAQGLGHESIIIGVAGAGEEIHDAAPSCSSPAASGGHAPSAGPAGAPSCPSIVDWYMSGRLKIDELVTPRLPLERINHAFELMHAGKSIRGVVTF